MRDSCASMLERICRLERWLMRKIGLTLLDINHMTVLDFEMYYATFMNDVSRKKSEPPGMVNGMNMGF